MALVAVELETLVSEPEFLFFFFLFLRDSANAVPTNRNYTTELSTFGIITRVNPAEVQWSGLALGPSPA